MRSSPGLFDQGATTCGQLKIQRHSGQMCTDDSQFDAVTR